MGCDSRGHSEDSGKALFLRAGLELLVEGGIDMWYMAPALAK